MTCDYTVESESDYSPNIRCGKETELDDYIFMDIGYHKNYPLDLCKDHLHLIDDVDEKMIDMNIEILEPHLYKKGIKV